MTITTNLRGLTPMRLDALAERFVWHQFRTDQEECYLLLRFPEGPKDGAFFVQVPNRSHEPEHAFEIHKPDAEPYISRCQLLGYIHTHVPGDGEKPSERDLSAIETGYLGAVHMVGSKTVYWYTAAGVVHISTADHTMIDTNTRREQM